MAAIAFALASSLSWGFSDFLGGLKARQMHLLTLMMFSNATGLVLVLVAVVVRGGGPPGGPYALFGALAAIAGTIGLAAFYRGLAVGVMSVVAPISATGAAVPVAAGIALGERPSAVQLAGTVVAVLGIVLASREGVHEGPDEAAPEERAARAAVRPGPLSRGVPLALLAAAGFGSFFVLIDRASGEDFLWAILAQRVTALVLLGAITLALRPPIGEGVAHVRALVVVGALDVAANLMFAYASTQGLISVVGVLVSLYPVVTIVLARIVLHERIQRVQQVGVALALAGVLLIAGG